MTVWFYYSIASLMFVTNVAAFLSNLASLPGNWVVVASTVLFCYFAKSGQHSMSWPIVGLLIGLAILGEIIEFAAGTAGAAKQGASRRAMALSVVGTLVGSIVGAMVGLPVPVVGSAVAALIGGALGAGLGAALGENWKGRDTEGLIQVGAAAFVGRILGTAGKLVVGGIMLVIATIDAFW